MNDQNGFTDMASTKHWTEETVSQPTQKDVVAALRNVRVIRRAGTGDAVHVSIEWPADWNMTYLLVPANLGQLDHCQERVVKEHNHLDWRILLELMNSNVMRMDIKRSKLAAWFETTERPLLHVAVAKWYSQDVKQDTAWLERERALGFTPVQIEEHAATNQMWCVTLPCEEEMESEANAEVTNGPEMIDPTVFRPCCVM